MTTDKLSIEEIERRVQLSQARSMERRDNGVRLIKSHGLSDEESSKLATVIFIVFSMFLILFGLIILIF